MTDGLLRVTKYSLKSLRWKSLILTAVLVLPSLGLRFLIFLDKITSDQLSPLYYRQSPFYTGFPSGIHFTFLYLTGIAFLIFCLMELPFKQKLMSRMPVSTAGIVSGLNVSLLIILCIVSLISNGAFRLFLFDADGFRKYWPVVGPTLFFMTSIVVVQWIYWDIQRVGFARLLFWISFVLGMCCWFRSRYYLDVYDIYSIAPWSNMTWPEFFTMLTVFVTAWIGAIRSCARVRCGAAVPSQTWDRYRTELRSLKHLTFITDRKLPGSLSAAFARLYWRDSGRLAAMVIIGIGGMVFFGALLTGTDHRDVGPLVLFFFFGTSVCLSAYLGASLLKRDSGQMKGYLAIVPLSDRDISLVLIRTLLTLFLLSIASVLLFGLAGGRLIFLLMDENTGIQNLWTQLIGPEWNVNLFYAIGLILLADWVFVANLVSLIWAPQRGFNELMVSIPTIGIVTAIVSGIWPSVGDILFLSISTLIWSVTILAYVHAYKTGLIHIGALWLAGLFCLIVPAVYWNYWSTSELPLKLLWSSLLILAVTPFAAIPLAVKWRRHR